MHGLVATEDKAVPCRPLDNTATARLSLRGSLAGCLTCGVVHIEVALGSFEFKVLVFRIAKQREYLVTCRVHRVFTFVSVELMHMWILGAVLAAKTRFPTTGLSMADTYTAAMRRGKRISSVLQLLSALLRL